MSEFDTFVDAVKDGAKGFAQEIFGGYQESARDDAQAFLDKTKADLEKWTKMLAQGEISKQDFTDLVQAKEALAKIHMLTQEGLALTKLERFRRDLINLVIEKAFTIFL